MVRNQLGARAQTEGVTMALYGGVLHCRPTCRPQCLRKRALKSRMGELHLNLLEYGMRLEKEISGRKVVLKHAPYASQT